MWIPNHAIQVHLLFGCILLVTILTFCSAQSSSSEESEQPRRVLKKYRVRRPLVVNENGQVVRRQRLRRVRVKTSSSSSIEDERGVVVNRNPDVRALRNPTRRPFLRASPNPARAQALVSTPAYSPPPTTPLTTTTTSTTSTTPSTTTVSHNSLFYQDQQGLKEVRYEPVARRAPRVQNIQQDTQV